MKTSRCWVLPGILLAIFLFSSCSYRHLIVSEVTDLFENGIQQAEQESNLHLLGQSLPAQIQLLETLAWQKPHDVRISVLLSRLYAAYAFMTLETELQRAIWRTDLPCSRHTLAHQRRRIGQYYQRGLFWAERALENRRPGFVSALQRLDRVDDALADATPNDVPALFWYGFNLAGTIQQHRSDIVLVAKAFQVEKTMHRVLALAPGYYHGSAHLVLMVYYNANAEMPGGNPDAALRHYRALLDMHGDRFLLNHLLYAYGYERLRGNRNEFQRIIDQILDAAGLPEELQLLNAVAVERAAIYDAAIDLMFDDGQEPRRPEETTP